MTRGRACGRDGALQALEAGEAGLLLVDGGAAKGPMAPLVERARALGVPVWLGSAGDMRRMSPDSAHPHAAIAMLGPRPDVDLETALARAGAHWLLHRVTYPSNAGFAIRTAEVSGAASVVIDGAFNHADRSRIGHVAMGADRLLPVHHAQSLPTIATAREHGARVIAVEAVGDTAPWRVDLTGSVLFVAGAERDGIAEDVLSACDDVVRIPMAGFVPSYSFQAAISAVATERLRQLSR